MSSLQPRSLPSLVLAAAMLLLSGCAVMFVGPYDEVTDRAITDLATKTEFFFAQLENSGGSYSQNKSFYPEVRAGLKGIRLRAELYRSNQGELKAIDLLTENIINLERLHKAGPLKGAALQAARNSIETNFRSLIQIELAKKRSSGVSLSGA